MRRFGGGRLLVATHNPGKLDEFAALLAPRGVTTVGAAALGLPVPDETAATFLGNARLKAHAGARASGLPALADDSGLEVEALGGAPGVRSAGWATAPQGRDFDRAMAEVRRRLEEAGASAPHRARFTCTLVLAWPDGEEASVTGVVAGRLVWPGRGSRGHGYDPVFQPDGQDLTFAEMDREAKNRLSHRALALRALVMECFT